MVTSNSPERMRGSLNFRRGVLKRAVKGLCQISPCVFSRRGAGVSKLTATKTMQQIQNIHQACMRNEIPQRSVMILVEPITGRSTKNEAMPMRKPVVKVTTDASFVPLGQKTPKRNTVVMGGARSEAMTLIAAKILEKRPP